MTKARDTKGRFAPGNQGRKHGSRNRATAAAEILLNGEAEALTRKAVDLALAGDTTALKICLDRIAPPPKGRRVVLDLPHLQNADDAPEAIAMIVKAVGDGTITAAEGHELANLIDRWRAAHLAHDLQRRVETLELEAEKKQ